MFLSDTRVDFAAGVVAVLLLTALSVSASEWSVTPGFGVTVPLSSEIDTPDPAYDVSLGVRRHPWGLSFNYTSGDGETEDGWITGGPSGNYDYFMAGLTLDYFIPMDEDPGWLIVVGAGPWFEHTEFTADASVPPAPSLVLVDEETDTVVLCGKGSLAYRWQHLEASISLRAFLGADNVTSAASFSLGMIF